jgi:phenylpyruvate tautomerase PptA (4-oxalocrotonate tautomerase family)
MPLVRITLAHGSDAGYRRAIADGVHAALVQTANVSEDDRFQVIEELPAANLIWSPGYLGMSRTEAFVIVQVFFNRGRSAEVKQALYAQIAERLAAAPGIRKEDVLVSLVDVPRENWSFGGGFMSYPPAP